MFTSLVVALDLEDTGDRALPLAASLAALGSLPVELLTVSSPGMPTAVDVYELEGRASTTHRLDDYSCVVLADEDAGAAIVEYMAARPTALLVMGATARGALTGHLVGRVSEYVLGHIGGPVLVAGPRTTHHRLVSPTLIACVGDSDRVDAAAPPIMSWLGSFGGPAWTVTVEPTGASDGTIAASQRLRQLADRLVAIGGGDPAAPCPSWERSGDLLAGVRRGHLRPCFRRSQRPLDRRAPPSPQRHPRPRPEFAVARPGRAGTAGDDDESPTRHVDAAR